MKLPKLPKIAFTRRPKRLHANAAARRAPATDDYYGEEPKTNLSSAFVVVLILHVVAVGGIYAFNSIQEARRGDRKPTNPTANTAKVATANADSANPTLPVEMTDAKNAETTPMTAPVSKGQVYQVKAGDTLTRIATLHGISIAELEESNGLKSSTSLRPGQTLNIPAGGKVAAHPAIPSVPETRRSESAPTVAAASKGNARTYIVAKGDTATSIARKFGVSADDLLKLNKIENAKRMQLGQTLKIPAKKSN